MTSNTSDKKPCSKCDCTNWVYPCEGCHVLFCIKHAGDHRNDLSIELNNIQQRSNHLQNIYIHHEKNLDHPLFSQIDVWEHDTIEKIKQTAQTVRDELQKFFDEINNRMKTVFNEFNEQLQTKCEKEDYTEIELNQWNTQLTNIKEQLETPYDIELTPDKDLTPIYLIKINTPKPDLLFSNLSFSQTIQLCEDSKTSECLCDKDEVNKTQSIIVEDNNECKSISEKNESNMVSQEEQPLTTNVVCCDILSTESGIFLDPIKTYHLVLLQLSSDLQSQLLVILNQLTDHEVEIFNQNEEETFLNRLVSSEQTTIFIDFFNKSLNEQNCLLDHISQLENVYSIYIRGIPSDDDNERAEFFRRYSKLKAIFDNEQRLMVQWTLDTVNEYKKTGDNYIQMSDKDKGRICFENGILLYKHLSEFLNEKRRIR